MKILLAVLLSLALAIVVFFVAFFIGVHMIHKNEKYGEKLIRDYFKKIERRERAKLFNNS
jgi:hypothetical protein